MARTARAAPYIADFKVGMPGANGVTGANIVIAVRAAHQSVSRRARDTPASSVMARSIAVRSSRLELGRRLAAACPVWQDNGFAATTTHPCNDRRRQRRAESIGIPAITVDGNDLVAVDTTAKRLIDEIRAGGGALPLCKTYRLTGHTGADAAGGGLPKRSIGVGNDPIARMKDLLLVAEPAVTLSAANDRREAGLTLRLKPQRRLRIRPLARVHWRAGYWRSAAEAF